MAMKIGPGWLRTLVPRSRGHGWRRTLVPRGPGWLKGLKYDREGLGFEGLGFRSRLLLKRGFRLESLGFSVPDMNQSL